MENSWGDWGSVQARGWAACWRPAELPSWVGGVAQSHRAASCGLRGNCGPFPDALTPEFLLEPPAGFLPENLLLLDFCLGTSQAAKAGEWQSLGRADLGVPPLL